MYKMRLESLILIESKEVLNSMHKYIKHNNGDIIKGTQVSTERGPMGKEKKFEQ